MLRPNPGVIQTGRNGMSRHDLSIRVLKEIAQASVQYARFTSREARCVLSRRQAGAPCFDAYELNVLGIQEA